MFSPSRRATSKKIYQLRLKELPGNFSCCSFEELLTYYENLQNPFDYANTFAKCRQLVARKTADLTDAQIKALGYIIS